MLTKAIIVNIGSSAARASLSEKFPDWKVYYLFAIIPVCTVNRNYNLPVAVYFGVSAEVCRVYPGEHQYF